MRKNPITLEPDPEESDYPYNVKQPYHKTMKGFDKPTPQDIKKDYRVDRDAEPMFKSSGNAEGRYKEHR